LARRDLFFEAGVDSSVLDCFKKSEATPPNGINQRFLKETEKRLRAARANPLTEQKPKIRCLPSMSVYGQNPYLAHSACAGISALRPDWKNPKASEGVTACGQDQINFEMLYISKLSFSRKKTIFG
jgi:hypothetical protein